MRPGRRRVAVEILVKENQIVPVGIVLAFPRFAVKGAAAGRRIAREDPDEPLGQRLRHFAERDGLLDRARGATVPSGP